eukprot:GGOE01028213.1.p1 GENE.GGOE01028213.1~~GGOE01028213.1.p1  ORF type:complete len:103 (+),score=1.89 GGOE01028213.1:130-438(+)
MAEEATDKFPSQNQKKWKGKGQGQCGHNPLKDRRLKGSWLAASVGAKGLATEGRAASKSGSAGWEGWLSRPKEEGGEATLPARWQAVTWSTLQACQQTEKLL